MTNLHRQRGMTLVITLLFMMLISMLAITGFNSSTTNVRITGNMMHRQEAMSAAQSVIEETISGSQFTTDPVAVAAAPYDVDIDGDGAPDWQARLSPAPTCQRVQIIRVDELDPDVATDMACMASSVATFSGIDEAAMATTAGESLCATTEWNVRATVDDARTGARVALNQGIGVRIPKTEANDFCK
jgi:type II secretory pathway pseudopilin PulG